MLPISPQSFKSCPSLEEYEFENAKLRLKFYTDQILRVVWTRQKGQIAYEPAQTPENPRLKIAETDEFFSFQTSSLNLKLNKSNGQLVLKTPQGELLNQDHPTLGIIWLGDEAICHKSLQNSERFIGMGEKTGDLDRKGSSFVHWNKDHFAYQSDSDPLYASIPFFIGLRKEGFYGVFLASTARSSFDFGASNERFVSFSVETGPLDYFYIVGVSPLEVIRNFVWLTGKPYLPPLWALGFQQCRYSYYPESEVLSVAQHFRSKKIPCDVLYYDIHYMDEYKVFTWDKLRFPEPKRLNSQLKDLGFRTVAILDPGIKKQVGYLPFDKGLEQDVFVKYPDHEPYCAGVWPGLCYFPDFGNSQTDDWWSAFFPELVKQGISGFWNDMNEPAVWGQTVPKILIHKLKQGEFSHKEVHNLYGYLMAKATYLSAQKALDGERPFVLSRSGFAGIQRWAALWTGDNVAYDEHFLLGIRLVSSLNISGVSFCGFDVGGFVGESSAELFMRWLSTAAFVPLMRMHSMINSRDSEPWSYGEQAEEVAKNYIEFRYRMLPYLYSLFAQASLDGTPVLRSLALYHPFQAEVFSKSFQNQFLLGEFLLVCPLESNQKINKVFLPEGVWYSLYDDSVFQGDKEYFLEFPPEKLPVFVQAGAILPLQNPIQFVDDNSGNDILQIHVYHSDKPSNFYYYEDDGKTFEYEKGDYCSRELSYLPEKQSFVIGKTQGKYKSKFKKIAVHFHGSLFCKGDLVEGFRFFSALSHFDPFYQSQDAYGYIPLLYKQIFDWSDAEIQVNF
jgi:alpha-glucosidase